MCFYTCVFVTWVLCWFSVRVLRMVVGLGFGFYFGVGSSVLGLGCRWQAACLVVGV